MRVCFFGSLFWVLFLFLALEAWATSVFVWNRLGKAWFVLVSSGKFWEGTGVGQGLYRLLRCCPLFLRWGSVLLSLVLNRVRLLETLSFEVRVEFH